MAIPFLTKHFKKGSREESEFQEIRERQTQRIASSLTAMIPEKEIYGKGK